MDIKYKIVEVEWFDAQSGSYQIDINELKIEEPIITHSTGYLLYKDKEKIILGFMLFGVESVSHWQMIPMGMVKKITEIKKRKRIKR
jgi:hypothetical protein